MTDALQTTEVHSRLERLKKSMEALHQKDIIRIHVPLMNHHASRDIFAIFPDQEKRSLSQGAGPITGPANSSMEENNERITANGVDGTELMTRVARFFSPRWRLFNAKANTGMIIWKWQDGPASFIMLH